MNDNHNLTFNDLFSRNLGSQQNFKDQNELLGIINDISIINNILFLKNFNEFHTEKNHFHFFNENWFSFITTSLNTLEYETSICNTIQNVLLSKEWLSIYKRCKGLFTFSETYKNDLKKSFNLDTINFIHPLPCSRKNWSPEKYLNASSRRIIQYGQDYRCLNAIFMLPPSNFEKILLATCNYEELNSILTNERTNLGNEYRLPMNTTATLTFDSIENIENWYDNSIFFMHLYDFHADWVVMKCIADHVPLLVNRLPSMVEYLGNDYPLYYNNYEEAIEKATNTDLVINAHEYLKFRSTNEMFSLSHFTNNLIKILTVQTTD